MFGFALAIRLVEAVFLDLQSTSNNGHYAFHFGMKAIVLGTLQVQVSACSSSFGVGSRAWCRLLFAAMDLVGRIAAQY